ncbi:MAG: hydroxylamine oxidoreductase [Phycisphaerae bacterium]|nr:hydroxylamine oxidoreductase [Phycisphaerae bacterium]
MSLNLKRVIVFVLGTALCAALIVVAETESRRHQPPHKMPLSTVLAMTPESSRNCVDCHAQNSPMIVEHWKGSTHSRKGVGCVECHQAERGDADGFDHYGQHIATVVSPRDCARCHPKEAEEFARSHHSKGGNILASLDNILAENAEGMRGFFDPHSPTPGRDVTRVNGMASADLGCRQCHGAKVALMTKDGGKVSVDELKPGPDGKPTNTAILAMLVRNDEGRPKYHPSTWPNTGIGRINLDGSLGSCSACHSRHDFSPRRARQPESCGKCHMGPDHPQKEIYEESKHGIAFRDLKEQMNLDSDSWILGRDYSAAPTCATCHMSGHTRNGGRITHDPGERISWTNRPPISLVMDVDKDHKVVTETDPAKRAGVIADSAEQKRNRMKDVCLHCHTPDYVNGFYQQYDDLVVLYNEKFAKAGKKIMTAFYEQGLLTKLDFDEEIEWTWYLLWHHEGRRARMGASMMGPDFTHWHGMFEVAERFYQELIPQAQHLVAEAAANGKTSQAEAVNAVIKDVLSRPEHGWRQFGDALSTGHAAQK